MKNYNGSSDENYITRLKELLDINKVKANAISIRPIKKKGKAYNKFIRIDFIGVAATTLFDVGGVYPSSNVYREIRALLLKTNELNKEGIFVKIRLLLEYPYSTSCYSRIKAEATSQRAAINEPRYTIRLDDAVERFEEEDYFSSFLIHTQKSILNNLQFLERELENAGNWNSPANPNSITLRFTAINPCVCSLFINNHIFYDTLLYSKLERQHTKFANYCPIIEFTQKSNKEAFDSFEDHFRYLWNHHTALDCNDATLYNKEIPNSISKVKEPSAIKYDNKIIRLSGKGKRNSSNYGNWESAAKHEINKLCSDLNPSPAIDSLFITCSWTKDDDETLTPNNYATLLADFLNQDFTNTEPPSLEVQIMQATTSEFLSKQLYQALDNSTIGLILMTRDIEGTDGRFYCRPNIYHELGYLMKQLGKDRIIIFREKDVYVPSNIQDIIRIEFDEQRMSLRYYDLNKKLYEITKISNSIFDLAMKNHTNRLQAFLEAKEIAVDEFNKAKDRIIAWQHYLGKL